MKIQFKDVGRHNTNWVAEIDTEQAEEDVCHQIAKSVLDNGRLMSRGIDVDYTESWKGNIYAGFRKVGTFAPEEA